MTSAASSASPRRHSTSTTPQKEDLVADVVTYNVERKKDEFERMVEGKNAVQVLKAMFALIGRKKTMDKDKRMVKDIMKYYPETFIKHAEDRSKALHNFFVDFFRHRKEGGTHPFRHGR